MNRKKAAKHRNAKFDAQHFLDAIGAKNKGAGLGTLPDGKTVAVSKGNTPGKVSVHRLDAEGDEKRLRSFNASQLDEMREWATTGVLASEEGDKAVRAAAPELLRALQDLVWTHDTKRSKPHDVWEAARAAIARAIPKGVK